MKVVDTVCVYATKGQIAMDEYYNFILQGTGPDYPPLTVDLARRIAYRLLADATDRRGWRQEFDQFDDDIKEELIKTWIEIVQRELPSPP